VNKTGGLFFSVALFGILTAAIAPALQADPAPEAAPSCTTSTPEEAKSLADQLYRAGQYQRAGVCYQAAGDLADANESFTKAVPAASEATAKDLKHQAETAKTLFTGVQQAFRSNH
jgi:hypothetical protein